MRIKGVMLVALCFLLLGSAVVYGKEGTEKYKIVFASFDVSSAGNYAYLGNSVQSMLSSRLAAKDRVVVVDRTMSEKELSSLKNSKQSSPAEGSSATEADYLVTGSLYGLKSGMNIQVVLYPFAAGKEVLRFESLVKQQENVIADVEKLAAEIAQTAFSGGTVAAEPVKTAGAGEGTSGFLTAHPEAAYKKSINAGAVVGATGSSIQVKAREGKRSVTLADEITTLVVGDIDGDGQDEIVVLNGNTLELYELDGKKIIKTASAGLPPAVECHAINLADLDGNGRMEIYASCTDGLNVSSLIVDWSKEKGFFVVSANIPWYIRPIMVPGKGLRLAGQKRGIEKTELLKAGVYLLDLDAAKMPKQAEQLPLPSGVNLFDFTFADLDGDGAVETVAIDAKERMRVFNRANELLWVSKKTFGGSQVYIGPNQSGAVNDQDRKNFTVDENADRDLIFIPGRLVVTDINADGRQEVVINENTLSAVSIFKKMRIYNDGVIVGLAWDGNALNELWRTGTFRGYIAGFGFSPLKNSGETGNTAQAEDKKLVGLYVGHLPRSGSLVGLLPGTGETQLTAYDLEFSREKVK